MPSLDVIKEYLASIGCAFPEIRLLQPADPFLDTTGEDLRRRIFITQENSGTTLCLRPEFTIPVCLAHLEQAGGRAHYAYGGSAFRQRKEEPAEFTQAGFEDLGNPDKLSADVNCIKVALETARVGGARQTRLVLGNQSIFLTLLDALEIPLAWRKKLLRSFGDTQLLASQLAALSNENSERQVVLSKKLSEALDQGKDAVTRAVTDDMLQFGLPLSGGRTPEAIADRLIEKAELSAAQLEPEKKAALEAFLKIDTKLKDAETHITNYELKYGIDLPGASQTLATLADSLQSDTVATDYRASFGRRLDYYTGLVFEIYREGLEKPIVGGGRYDHLLTLLGSKSEIPAVGFAVWIDRLGGAE